MGIHIRLGLFSAVSGEFVSSISFGRYCTCACTCPRCALRTFRVPCFNGRDLKQREENSPDEVSEALKSRSPPSSFKGESETVSATLSPRNQIHAETESLPVLCWGSSFRTCSSGARAGPRRGVSLRRRFLKTRGTLIRAGREPFPEPITLRPDQSWPA